MKDKIEKYFTKLFKILRKREMAILPANIAFYLILAIIPLLTIIVLLASKFGITIEMLTDMIANVMPKQVANVLIGAISGKGFDTNVGFFNIFAFILASNGTHAIINTSNALYNIKDNNWFKDRISAIFILIIIIILIVFLLIVPVFGENILNLIFDNNILGNFKDNGLYLFNIIKWPLSMLIIYFNIKLIYTIAPSKNIVSKETTLGAGFTTLLWMVAIIVFKFYINYFAHYDIVYGNLGNIIILMVWFYFMSYIFVLGMAINVSRREELELLEETQRIELEKIEKKNKKNKKVESLNEEVITSDNDTSIDNEKEQ